MARVGIIGDTHLPWVKPGYMEWCKKTFRKYKVQKVIHIGDLVDNHSIMFHQKEPDIMNPSGEYYLTKTMLSKWFKAFPKLTWILGNHDLLPARQLKSFGLDPDVYLKSYKEIYDLPAGWDVVNEIVIDGVLYHHGETATGVNGFRVDAERRMMSTVTGHAHGNAGVSATACDHRLVWGMAVGCGINHKAPAFKYGKKFAKKPIISCGLVLDGEPMVKYMDLGER